MKATSFFPRIILFLLTASTTLSGISCVLPNNYEGEKITLGGAGKRLSEFDLSKTN